MKSVIYKAYGPPSVLHLAEVEKPQPKSNEVLVQVYASTVTSGAVWVRQGRFPGSSFFTLALRLMFGITKPRRPILGFEFSGIVEAVGPNVTRFRAGDAVYGTTTGLPNGAYAEYVCVPERWSQGVIAKKPAQLTFEEAAALPVGGMTALQLLGKTQLRAGQNILIYGASGSVGTYAVQLAKHVGATVTGVCSTANVSFVQSLGADTVIDYTCTDITQYGGQFDVVFDAVGKLPAATLKTLLTNNGRYISVRSMTNERTEHLDALHQMIEAGKLRPAIDRTYPLEQIVDAHEYVDTGRKRGNVVICI
ncbi:NAD(P)-dependent alcohol dehydrogenase [Spirosoma montaniterrae]|uniref:NADPH:quinone reductase n=1 Tax=Spirosoma montaniterrae TaxID=1178516 RepID=A0A1P9WX21_9BACT|nr:NAD(P)-dependent alcohol dehydrogenase [Spirosoma montaniterrae]AQG79900.1 NADPH:quinone reductase [Spirosoma montaniterrae]